SEETGFFCSSFKFQGKKNEIEILKTSRFKLNFIFNKKPFLNKNINDLWTIFKQSNKILNFVINITKLVCARRLERK
ncbi:hypothetical protein BpHYR1_034045, partial [Brachionus plicatilis]